MYGLLSRERLYYSIGVEWDWVDEGFVKEEMERAVTSDTSRRLAVSPTNL